MQYETVIGMELHIELSTSSKMFCSCSANHFLAPPNRNICPTCTAQPGALPVINRRAVEFTVMTGIALNCCIQNHNVFARKNYVYPDLPKGYQISQYELPLCRQGSFDLGDGHQIGIERVHLEEDTGKLTHHDEASLVDLNRAGVPLMEIVSDSSLRSAAEAFTYVTKIRQLVRYLGASTGDMEKGAMRCEVNISVRPVGSKEYGTKVEIKNLNSFRAVRNAIRYETTRQIQLIKDGNQVLQVTMGWDESAGVTRQQRSKESSQDYRYFPEPDLVDLKLENSWIRRVRHQLPELPLEKAARFSAEYGLGSAEIEVIIQDRAIADYFECASIAGSNPRMLYKWITRDLFSRLKDQEADIANVRITPAALAELLALVGKGTINQTVAREVFATLWDEGGSPANIISRRSLAQISDAGELDAEVSRVLTENTEAADKIRAGDAKPLNALLGQVMRATRGKANPHIVRQLLQRKLGMD